MKIVARGWAVYLSLYAERADLPTVKAWLNHGGGYSPDRTERRIWGSKQEAREAMIDWGGLRPKLVRITMKGEP